jgi:hypothetical protein
VLALQPRFFPKEDAVGLASSVSGPVTTRTFEVYRIQHAAPAGLLDVVAGLVRHLGDPHSTPAERQHFRLQRQAIKACSFVERRKYLVLRAYDDPIPHIQPKWL